MWKCVGCINNKVCDRPDVPCGFDDGYLISSPNCLKNILNGDYPCKCNLEYFMNEEGLLLTTLFEEW